MRIESYYAIEEVCSIVPKVSATFRKSKLAPSTSVTINGVCNNLNSLNEGFFAFLQACAKSHCFDDEVEVVDRVADCLRVAFAACGANSIEIYYDNNAGLIINPSDDEKEHDLNIRMAAARLSITDGNIEVETKR